MNDKINKFKNLAKEQLNKIPTEKIKDKFDEQYNKLPLDNINEKLGGKVDVKSTNFKIVLTAVLGAILILIMFIFLSSSVPTFDASSRESVRESLAEFRDYYDDEYDIKNCDDDDDIMVALNLFALAVANSSLRDLEKHMDGKDAEEILDHFLDVYYDSL